MPGESGDYLVDGQKVGVRTVDVIAAKEKIWSDKEYQGKEGQ